MHLKLLLNGNYANNAHVVVVAALIKQQQNM